MGKNRLEAFSDGIIAIIITVMISASNFGAERGRRQVQRRVECGRVGAA